MRHFDKPAPQSRATCAMGYRQTWRLCFPMSALPPKADSTSRAVNVRSGPEAENLLIRLPHGVLTVKTNVPSVV